MRLIKPKWAECVSTNLEIEFVSVSLSVHFGHDVLVVIVAKCSAQFVVIHVWLAFPFSPSPGDFICGMEAKVTLTLLLAGISTRKIECKQTWIGQLEFAICAFPCDAVRIAAVRKKLE